MYHKCQLNLSPIRQQSYNLDQQVTVRVIEIDEQGRINLSMLFGEDA